jgi:hypothetical protein
MAEYVKPGVYVREVDFSRIVIDASQDPEVLKMSEDFMSRLKNLLGVEEDYRRLTVPKYGIMGYELVFWDSQLSIKNLESAEIELFEYSNPHRFKIEVIKEFMNRDPA